MTQYVIRNPNNPIVRDLYKDIPLVDSQGNVVTDAQGRVVCDRYVVQGSVGVSEETVDTKIQALGSNFVDTTSTQTVGGNKSFSGTITVTTPTKTVDGQTVTDTDDNTTKAANTKFVQAVKAELETDIADIAEKSNAITVSDTAPNVANMPIASGVMHPSQNIITENPDVSILALQQDMWAYDPTKDYIVGSFVIYNNSIYQCLVANGPSSTVANPSNVTYWTQIPTMEDLKNKFVPTGTILLYAGSVLPDTYLGCQGAPFDPTIYTDLYAKIGTTYGGTSDSPLLPDMRDRYPIGAGTNVLGTKIAEQLPNINGSVQEVIYTSYVSSNNLMTVDHLSNARMVNTSNTYGCGKLSFNANSSNSIYTDNGKVYPASIALNFIIKS